ncbi:MAG: HAD family hydrolase [Ruminococcaceae bacterium]|nr:HAD family hydrolase [Oscillospiraceae bacterium]
MDFSKYMIVTDLDGTFLGKGARMVPRNLEAVRRFQAGGGLFTIATGRLHLNIRSSLGDPALLVNAPIICCNGAYLYDPVADQIRDCDLIPEEDARDILAFLRSYYPEYTFRVSSPYDVRVESLEGQAGADTKSFNPGTVTVSAPAESWPMDDWFKIVVRGEGERFIAARDVFQEHLGDRLTATMAGARLWEVQKPGITKALGLEKLKRAYNGVENDRLIIACGDQENDLAMLKAADIAVAPANAIDAVKDVSTHVFSACDEGVIADVIEAIEAGIL